VHVCVLDVCVCRVGGRGYRCACVCVCVWHMASGNGGRVCLCTCRVGGEREGEGQCWCGAGTRMKCSQGAKRRNRQGEQGGATKSEDQITPHSERLASSRGESLC